MTYTRAVHSLDSCRMTGPSVVCSGKNGALILTLLRRGIYRVSYALDEFSPSPALIGASEQYFDDERAGRTDVPDWTLSDEGAESYILLCDDDRIEINRSHAVVTVYRGGKRIHGGEIGSSDTVLPRYPFRVLGGRGEEARGRLNFRMEEGDLFYGLGDKTGGLNKRGERYHMFNRDALGYHASYSDPLYKSIPFLIKQNREEGIFSGLFFPMPCLGEIDLGRESDYYFSVEMTGAPFSYVLFAADTPWDILEGYSWLTGRPSLPPLFTFGFLGSSMNYTDPDDADQRVGGYFDRIEENRIPCEGFYFSSGYVMADNGERYTFEWNKKKFPDPKAAIGRYRERGYHIACNIKPGFLVTHPRYQELRDKGYFIKDNEGNAYKEYYWGNNASFLDFSNPEALAWWKGQLKERFLDYGVTGIWNDNNEYELEDRSLEAQKMRPHYPVLMSKASWDVMHEVNPGKRPWIISRSGSTGIQKYARTWSGDNVSDWESMKYNTYMGMGLGLSGIPFYGHDIGGFFGDRPDETQFIRWCQSAVFQPRFVIHSWNPDGNPTEPWSYPGALDVIRELVEIHYEFMPSIYNSAVKAAAAGTPMERPLVLMFPGDPGVDPDSIHYMFGEDILVLSAVEEGEEEVSCYLPEGQRWYDPVSAAFLEGGETVRLDYPCRGVRYLIREGSVIFRAPGCRKLDTGYFENLHFDLYPVEGTVVREYSEDNGEDLFRDGSFNRYRLELEGKGAGGSLRIVKIARSKNETAGRSLTLTLPGTYAFENGEQTLVMEMKELDKDVTLPFRKI